MTALGNAILSSATYLVLSLAGIVVLIGFLRLRRWSWVLLMAWTGVSLIISLVDYFYSHPNYAVMASNVIIAFALNITDVQRIYGIRRDDGSQPLIARLLRSLPPTWNCSANSSRWFATPRANNSSRPMLTIM